jgi:hypothetical protein
MDAIALGREGNPHQADWIVGTRWKIQRFFYVDTAQSEGGVVVVGRIFGNARDLKLARWGGPLSAPDGCRVNRNNRIVLVVSQHPLAGAIDLDPRDLPWQRLALNVGDNNLCAGTVERGVRVELAQ